MKPKTRAVKVSRREKKDSFWERVEMNVEIVKSWPKWKQEIDVCGFARKHTC